MKKILFACLVGVLLLTGCGKKKVKLEEIKTLSNNQDIVSQLSKDPMVSDMVLLGRYYKLPAKLQDFFDNGWEFIGNLKDNPYEQLVGMTLNSNSYIDVVLMNDLKMMKVRVVNTSSKEEVITNNSIVSTVTVYNDKVNEADDFVVKSGINLNTTMKDADRAYSLIPDYESNKYTVNLYREEMNMIHIEPLTLDKQKIEFIRVSGDIGKEDYQMSPMEFDQQNYNTKKSATLELKRNCYITSKKYPMTTDGYKKILSDLHAKEDIDALYIKGTVIDKAYASLSNDLLGFSSKDIYIIEDENGSKYAFYAKVSEDNVIGGLNIGDVIELYSTNVELMNTKNDGYYPLLKGKIVMKDGIEIANIAEILY